MSVRAQAYQRGIATFWQGLVKCLHTHTVSCYTSGVAWWRLWHFIAWKLIRGLNRMWPQLRNTRLRLGCDYLEFRGRAQADAAHVLPGLDRVTLTWRMRREGLLTRLLNLLAGSAQQITLIIVQSLRTSWLRAAHEHLRLVSTGLFPSIMITVAGPFVHSSVLGLILEIGYVHIHPVYALGSWCKDLHIELIQRSATTFTWFQSR